MKRPSSVRVRTVNQLWDELFFDSWRPEIGRFRPNHAFRGMPRAGTSLMAGLSHLKDPGLEGHLLRNFRKYAPQAAVPRDNIWNWLALAQHHGLPTRLLDWTYSPLVALHFVTERIDAFRADGVVWCLDFVQANADLPSSLSEALATEGSNVFTAEMLEQAAPTLPALEALGKDPFLMFLEPPALDDRIVNQFALFSVMSTADGRLDQWVARRPSLCRRIVIVESTTSITFTFNARPVKGLSLRLDTATTARAAICSSEVKSWGTVPPRCPTSRTRLPEHGARRRGDLF
jgi:hypothetical protein